MKAKLLFTALLFSSCLTFATPAECRIRVSVRDEHGKVLLNTRAIQLAPGRAALPVTAYERIGLVVERRPRARQVSIAMPDSDSGIKLFAGSHRVRSFESSQLLPERYSTPVAVLRKGKFYATASVVNRAFNDVFTMAWDSRTQTVTIQRKVSFGQHLKRLR